MRIASDLQTVVRYDKEQSANKISVDSVTITVESTVQNATVRFHFCFSKNIP